MTGRYTLMLLLLLAPTLLHAQRITPLHHLISVNSLISRPESYRKLQLGIEKEWGNTEKGIKLDLLDERMRQLREGVLSNFDALNIKLEKSGRTTSRIVVSFRKWRYEIPITGQSFQESFASAEANLAAMLNDLLGRAVERATDGMSTITSSLLRQTLVVALSIVLKETQGTSSGDAVADITQLINTRLRKFLQDAITFEFPQFNTGDVASWQSILDAGGLALGGTNVLKLDSARLDTFVKLSVKSAREIVSRSLDEAESKIRTAVAQFNRWFLSGNAGLAVAEGQGGLGGGIHLSFTQSSNLQIGAYVNSEFQSDSLSAPEALFGAQIRYAWDRVEADLLFSAVRGNGWGLEAGLGASMRLDEKVIVGAAFFSVVEPIPIEVPDPADPTKKKTLTKQAFGWSLGATVRGTSENSPTFVIGLTRRDGKTSPIVQIVYPLRPQQ